MNFWKTNSMDKGIYTVKPSGKKISRNRIHMGLERRRGN